ncbi:hypothetical protein NBRC116493_02960 [Aurantivibrio infirmus]
MIKKIFILSVLLLAMGCEEKLEYAIEASRTGVALIASEDVAAGIESLTKAKEAYEEMLTVEPGNALYQNNYGWVLMQLGEYDAAEVQFKKAAEQSDSINHSSAPRKNLTELAKLKTQ